MIAQGTFLLCLLTIPLDYAAGPRQKIRCASASLHASAEAPEHLLDLLGALLPHPAGLPLRPLEGLGRGSPRSSRRASEPPARREAGERLPSGLDAVDALVAEL